MFQVRCGKVDEFYWWDMGRIQTNSGTQFTSKKFQEGLSVNGVWLEISSPDHQEMNGQVEVTWGTLQTITYLIMVHTQVYEKNIHL